MGLRVLFLGLLVSATGGMAQTVLLDSFDAGAARGSVRPGTSWVGNVTPNPGSITVGGSARDENGWGATGQSINATGMTFLTITAQRDEGHAAANVAVQFEDRNLNTQVFSVSAASFAIGSLTQVQLAIGNWSGGFDSTQITGWSIGGGALGLTPFRMTFDHLALTAAASPGVPVAPAVTGDYGARARARGESISFTVSATGTAPLAYQWFKNGTTPVAGNASATTATLTLANLTALDSGPYSCTVTNAAGSVTSGNFVLSVSATPATVTLSNLASTYTGSARTATVATVPFGLPVIITYNNSAVAPVSAGSYAVVATVNDPNYTGRAEGTLVVAKSPQSIGFAPLPTTIRVGEPFTLTPTATSGGPVVLTVVRGNATITGTSVTPRDGTTLTIRATQEGDGNHLPVSTDLSFTTTKRNQSIDFRDVPGPIASTAPVVLDATASSGLPVSFSVVAGPAVVSGNNLTANASGQVIVRASQAGNDTFNAAPDVDRTVAVTITAPPPPTEPPPPPGTPAPRLVNFSTRAPAGAADQVAIAGFVIAGEQPKQVLIRAVGPGLGAFGVTGVLAAPKLELFHGSTLIATNTGWMSGGDAATAELTAAAARVAAFALGANSADAALVATLPQGNYTAVISAADGNPGVGLIEVYDFSATGTGRGVSNLSVRALSGAAAETLIVGVVVQGTTSKRLLIRAVGPGLAAFGVSGVLAQPQLAVFSGSTEIARNAGWSLSADAALIAQTSGQVGAFPLQGGSSDSALIVNLAPGAYTAQVSGATAASGVALVEVYEVP